MDFLGLAIEGATVDAGVISPPAGEMGGSPEGGAVPPAFQLFGIADWEGARSTLPPSALPGISPARAEIGCGTAFSISVESPADAAARDALLDRAMGPRWRKKSSHKLRRGRLPAEGLAFVAKDAEGKLVGTVRLWDVAATSKLPISPSRGEINRALLLGPLAVDPALKSSGVGSALMRHAIAEARRFGHLAILLVGDAPYYTRFGFSAQKTDSLAMPGPYERERFLALELVEGALDGASGVLRANGRRICGRETVRVAA